MDYPAKFPPEAQDRVEAAKILAGLRFERDKRTARWTSDIEWLLIMYILRIFRMFVREARRLRLWRAAEMDSQCREFLRLLTIDAYYEKGYDNQGRRLSDMISHVNGSILERIQQEFNRSPEWRYFESQRLRVTKPEKAAVLGGSPADTDTKSIDQFIRKVHETTGRHITRPDIALVAGYTLRTLYYFQAGKARAEARNAFHRVLQMDPKVFIAELDKKTCR